MKRSRNPEMTRQQIIEATKKILSDGGYFTQFSLAQVAQEAGVSKGGLLHHFPSKEALLTAVCQDLITRFEQQLADTLSEEAEGPGRFTRAYVQTVKQAKAIGRISPVLLAFMRSAEADAPSRFTYWQQKTEQDGLDEVMATIIRLAVDGLLYTEVIDAQAIEPKLRRQILDRLYQLSQTS